MQTEKIFSDINNTEKFVDENRQKQEQNRETLSEYKSDIEVYAV